MLCILAIPLRFVDFSPALNTAEAITTVEVGNTTWQAKVTAFKNTVTAAATTATAGSVASLAIKENILDPIAYMLAKTFLRQMVSSIVNWINSGFQGSPAFVTDLDGFLRSVADSAIGEFIYNDPSLNFLCSPFQLDIKIALATQYSNTRPENFQPQCTLSDVVDNVDGFMSGDFSQGNWGSMIELVQTPVNNPTGAYIAAQSEAYVRIIDNQGKEIKKLDFGNGFFSMEICDVAEKQSGAKPNCTIGTPGSVIANSINKALGAGQDELIAADEINEIFNALFAQLAQKAISGVFGLLGVGGNSVYKDNSYGFGNNGSYLDAIAELDASTTVPADPSGQSIIDQALVDEQRFLTLQNQIISRINAIENNYNNTKISLQTQSCNFSVAFPQTLTDERDDAEQKAAIATTAIGILTVLKNAYDNAADVNEQLETVQEYTRLRQQGIFHDSLTNVQLDLHIEYELDSDIAALQTQLDAAVRRCNSGGGGGGDNN